MPRRLENRTNRPVRRLVVVTYLCAMLSLPAICAARGSSVAQERPVQGHSTRRNPLSRRIQSWMIQQKAIPSTRSVGQTATVKSVDSPRGSVFSFRCPTKERLGKWFGADDEVDNDILRSMLRYEFNHDSVGMTNPCIQLETDARQEHTIFGLNRKAKAMEVRPASTKTAIATEDASEWWPSLSFLPKQPRKWRVLKYRRRVGTGRECYERVRDAALDWKFEVGDEMGLMSVPSSSELRFRPKNPANIPTPFVQRGRYTVSPVRDDDASENRVPLHQCIGAARRFVSYSAKRILPFAPKLYSVNPVMVAYGVVDQRGRATTFTSTAYATMKGHLLRGEERVTVALRDGTDAVEVEILSISRAGPSLKGKMVWPFIGKMQSTFFEKQMDYLSGIGASYFAKPALPLIAH